MIPLHFKGRHLFLEISGELWLFDTGASSSFGSEPRLVLADKEFQVDSNYMGMTADTLSEFVSVDCVGLLGADVLGQYDFLLDLENGAVEASTDNLEHSGTPIPLEDFRGIPVVGVLVGERTHRMFFDTGAQVSFFQHDSLVEYPPAGEFEDFYPGFGQFRTDTYNVDVKLGGVEFSLRCGTLPGPLAATLLMAGTEGIVGNSILNNRRCGYFPRRKLLVL